MNIQFYENINFIKYVAQSVHNCNQLCSAIHAVNVYVVTFVDLQMSITSVTSGGTNNGADTLNTLTGGGDTPDGHTGGATDGGATGGGDTPDGHTGGATDGGATGGATDGGATGGGDTPDSHAGGDTDGDITANLHVAAMNVKAAFILTLDTDTADTTANNTPDKITDTPDGVDSASNMGDRSSNMVNIVFGKSIKCLAISNR